jgi:hypothetical protein
VSALPPFLLPLPQAPVGAVPGLYGPYTGRVQDACAVMLALDEDDLTAFGTACVSQWAAPERAAECERALERVMVAIDELDLRDEMVAAWLRLTRLPVAFADVSVRPELVSGLIAPEDYRLLTAPLRFTLGLRRRSPRERAAALALLPDWTLELDELLKVVSELTV